MAESRVDDAPIEPSAARDASRLCAGPLPRACVPVIDPAQYLFNRQTRGPELFAPFKLCSPGHRYSLSLFADPSCDERALGRFAAARCSSIPVIACVEAGAWRCRISYRGREASASQADSGASVSDSAIAHADCLRVALGLACRGKVQTGPPSSKFNKLVESVIRQGLGSHAAYKANLSFR